MLTFCGSAGNEVKANTAYTRAQECLFVVGNLNILQSSKLGRNGPIEFVLESLQLLKQTNAFKDFSSTALKETVAGVVLEESEVAEAEGLLNKGSGGREPQEILRNGGLANGLTKLAITKDTASRETDSHAVHETLKVAKADGLSSNKSRVQEQPEKQDGGSLETGLAKLAICDSIGSLSFDDSGPATSTTNDWVIVDQGPSTSGIGGLCAVDAALMRRKAANTAFAASVTAT